MHRLWFSLAVLLLLLGACLGNTRYLAAFTGQLTDQLREAEACVVLGDRDVALDKTEAALEHWLSRETYLHMTLCHSDTDEVLLAFREVLQFLSAQEAGGEYFAANARLITRIGLLCEMEQLSLKNLF